MSQAILIDDNKFNTNILAQCLSEEGFESITVNHPKYIEDALNSADDVQIIFLDLEMPELDGFDVLKTLKMDPRLQNVPIVAHSVHISEIKVAHNAGFDGFIGKPLNADKFPRQLSRVLEGKGVWETA